MRGIGLMVWTAVAGAEAPVPALNLALPPPVSPPVTELPGVTVRGQRDALQDSRRRLDELKASLPCMGCERYKPDTPPVWMPIVQGLLPTEAPPPGPPEDRARLESQAGHCTPENPFGCLGQK